MHEKFFIKSLKIKNKEREIFDVRFLDENKYTDNTLFSTVIIGTNGTGKSYLLSMIVEVFRAVENRKNNKDVNLKYDYYCLEYFLNGEYYLIEIVNRKFKKNENLATLKLPSKILAVSFMINDKFIFQKDEAKNDEIYNYLGIRRTSNASWINSIERKLTESIIMNISNNGFINKTKEVLNFLNYRPVINLFIESEMKTYLKRGITEKQLIDKIKKLNKTNDFRKDSIKKISEEEIKKILNFSIESSDNSTSDKRALLYKLDFENEESFKNIKKHYNTIKLLIDLRVLKAPKLFVYKDEEFEFENASSGEKQFLFTMLNIISKIQQNSLVLIDEPELSLHPNWQMKYIDCLKTTLKDFSTCHFILATHSHYIVSDLKEDSSSLIVLDNKKKMRTASLIEYSTYAWSAENILYNIFKVRTSRNHYFEMDLRELLFLVKENSNDIKRISKLILKLKEYILDKNDPILLIIEEAERYLKNVGKNQR